MVQTVNPFAAPMTSYDVLDDVFRICRQDVIGRPAAFLVSRARSGEPELNRTNVWGWLNPFATLFFGETASAAQILWQHKFSLCQMM